jgi:hypothetical protein
MLSSSSSKSYSSSMSPTICSSTSSMVIRPATPRVFVDHDGHVVAVGAEVAQQHVQALRLGNEDGRAQHVAHVETLVGVIAQQVLGQQDADHLVAFAVDGREARVRGFQHVRQPALDGLGDVDHVHLRAGHHDVAGGEIGNLEHAFDHRQGVGVDQVALLRVLQQFEQLGSVLGFGGNHRGQPFEQRPVGFDVVSDVGRMLRHG